MIRFACVNCSAVLRVGDEKAGKIAVCPKCKSKMQIPDAVDEPTPHEDATDDPRIQATAPTPSSHRPRRPEAEEVGADSGTDDDARSDETDDDDRPRRRRRRRRRKSGRSSSTTFESVLNPFTIGLVVGVGLWGLMLVLHLVGVPLVGIAAIGIGVIVAGIGRIWFLSIAFSDDSTVGYMVMWVPFYEFYYLISNFAETWKPYLLNMIGGGLAIIAFCSGGLRSMMDDDRGPLRGPGNFQNQPDDFGDGDDEGELDPVPGMPGRPNPGGPPRFPKRQHDRAVRQLSVFRARSRAMDWNASANCVAAASTTRHWACQSESDWWERFGGPQTSA